MNYPIALASKGANGSVFLYEPAPGGKPGAPIAKFSADLSNKPDYRYKYATVNCIKYRLCWDWSEYWRMAKA